MNSVRINGEIVSRINLNTNRKKQCPEATFLLAAPFSHPNVKTNNQYRAFARTYVFGDDAEWIYDNLYEGAHLEIRHGFIQTWYFAQKRQTFYRLVGNEIERERSGDLPDDYVPYNVGRFSGFFRSQFASDIQDDGTLRVGISIAATPDMAWYGTDYRSILSVILYGELAEKVDGKLKLGDPIDLIEGILQPFRGTRNKVWGIYVIATDIKF